MKKIVTIGMAFLLLSLLPFRGGGGEGGGGVGGLRIGAAGRGGGGGGGRKGRTKGRSFLS